jgi:hypothetical protein
MVGAGQQHPSAPLLEKDLDEALSRARFREIRHFGGLDGSPFEREESGDLVIVAPARQDPL